MIVIETLNTLLFVVIVVIIVFIIRFITQKIRVNRITKNSLKNNTNIKRINNKKIKGEMYTDQQLDSAITLFVKSIEKNSITESIEKVTKAYSKSLVKEFDNIQSEIRLGLNVSKSFERLYKKTNNQKTLTLVKLLKLYDKQKISLKDITTYFETKEAEEKMIINKTKKLIENNDLVAKILSVISLSIMVIIFIVSVEKAPPIELMGWIVFLIITILTYLVYFEINNYYCHSNYPRIRKIKQKMSYIRLSKILYKNKIPFNESIKLIEDIENEKVGKEIISIIDNIWNKRDNELLVKNQENRIIKELKKIPYKLTINWTICTTIIVIAIVYLTK